MSIGMGKRMVELRSAAMALRVWRYLSCRAEGDSAITSAASFRALEAFNSPSAAITWVGGVRFVCGAEFRTFILTVLHSRQISQIVGEFRI